ncbi:MAG: ImmA/IrrE family metallo-endopeptidase [Bdellovibrionales bacterium]
MTFAVRVFSSVLLSFGLGLLQAHAVFLPESEIRYDTLKEGRSNMTEEEFKTLIARVQKEYEPLVALHGGKLTISGDWRSDKLNAAAAQIFGTWRVQISGALARRPELTPDGFALILCHELGHHLGGYALGRPPVPFGGIWAANEGQADYFATQVCARKLWGPETARNAEARKSVDPLARQKCEAVWSNETDRDLCYRIAVAVESLSITMMVLKNETQKPSFQTPDPAAVPKTSDAHPATQCRMDTSLAGALCVAYFDEKLIPGKNVAGGPFSVEAEREAAKVSCMKSSGYSEGLRPTCWFKSQID